MNTPENATTLLVDFNSAAAKRYRGVRGIKDKIFRYCMTAGGIGVIVAIVLIAFYLLYVVLPMFKPAHLEELNTYPVPGDKDNQSIYFTLEEQNEVASRLDDKGNLVFFKSEKGDLINEIDLFPEADEKITAFQPGDYDQGVVALGTESGKVLLAKFNYQISYPKSEQSNELNSKAVKKITPYLTFPLGKNPVLFTQNTPVKLITAQSDSDNNTTVAVVSEDNKILIKVLSVENNAITGESTLSEKAGEINVPETIDHIIIDKDQRKLYAAGQTGHIYYYDISKVEQPVLVDHIKSIPDGVKLTDLKLLSGSISLLVGDSRGRITQLFSVRDANNNYTLQEIRYFDDQKAPITEIVPEYFRKVFMAFDADGVVGIYNTTGHRTIKLKKFENGVNKIAVSPRANVLLVETKNHELQKWEVDNEYPEISWHSLWGKVWYESRNKPEYIWQSSSASSDFEPKFSLTPLLFGTLKAAFFAMLFAIPLSILGAMYTAYFMSTSMRNIVKPTIEMMGALPTVILGFLAGLWLAPYTEKNLPGMFMLLVFVPLSIFIAAYCWHRLPSVIKNSVDDGWEAALLIPVVLLSGYLALLLGQPIERLFFDGNMPLWLTHHGIAFDQRNSLVVGIAMGFAVIPTIFSISEDAIFSVPKHLTTGSLALGATTWQTMVRIVLLTASPGIFSAVMIGFGRAVGETMIVVMATGNTAIMDMSIFQGFRALSANIAVEMPESELGSSHYRILFLAGFVLFLTTFVVNTFAEIVRQRLRRQYSTL